jgi:hypothetical protein
MPTPKRAGSRAWKSSAERIKIKLAGRGKYRWTETYWCLGSRQGTALQAAEKMERCGKLLQDLVRILVCKQHART